MSIAPNPSTTKNANEFTLEQIMTRSVHTIGLNDTAAEALRIMLDGINTLPVINDMGQCVGMISRSDLTESLYQEDQSLAQHIESEAAPSSFGAVLDTCNDRLVRELMNDDLAAASPETTVQSACEQMVKKKIHHLPVVDQKQMVVGMVSSFDLIQWFST